MRIYIISGHTFERRAVKVCNINSSQEYLEIMLIILFSFALLLLFTTKLNGTFALFLFVFCGFFVCVFLFYIILN